MAQVKLIPHTDFVKVPWKNGLGYTQEIDKLNLDGTERFVWRLSIAAVENDGAFSSFDGYQRNITVLTGSGMELDVNGKSSGLIKAFNAFPFSGDADTNCTLIDGKISDFNVIYDPSRVSAQVCWHDVCNSQIFELEAKATIFIIAGTDTAEVRIDDSEFCLNKWDVLQIKTDENPATVTIVSQYDIKIGIVTITS